MSALRWAPALALVGCIAQVQTSDSVAVPIIAVDCTSSCADTTTDEGQAICYSCQCKKAMDGWMPSTDEYQCANGEEIVIYTSAADGSLSPVDADVSTCANPTLLYGTCTPGGRLGQITHGTVTVKYICRRNTYVAGAAADESLPFDDVGAIFYNSRNGASCWYDDNDGTGIAGRNMPDMDLTKDDEVNRTAYLGFYYYTEGKSCTSCHDNDPYNYTPYLQSVGWVTDTYTSGAFQRVTASGTFEPNGTKYLTSPDAAACEGCHRITSNATCSSWAPDSYGVAKLSGYEERVVQAAADATSDIWWLGTWMPYVYAGDSQIKNHDLWESTYGKARDTIQSCCQQPGTDMTATDGTVCTWADTPT